MSIISLIVILAIVGVLLWLVQTKLPMDPTIKLIIHIVVIAAVVVYLLKVFGIWGDISVPRI